MAIVLIDKIAPKNDAFTGMVDAEQVIGASGAGGYLPSSTISGNSIQEYQLKISNSPTNGYFLEYKDNSDKLTWAQVSTTDVAWSGAIEFYSVSSLVNTLNNWYANSSQKYSQAYISTSTGIFALQSDLDNNYYTKSEIDTISGSIITHTSNNYYDKTWMDTYSGNVDTRLEDLENNIEFIPTNYITSSNAIIRFADSSATQTKLGNKQDTLTAGDHSTDWETAHDWYTESSQSISEHIDDSTIHFTQSDLNDDYAGSGAFQTHKDDDDIHFPSSSILNWLNGEYQQSGATGFDSSWSGATGYYTVSSSVKVLDTWYDTSSSKLSKAYASTSTGVFEPSLTKGNLTASSPLTFDNTRQVIGGTSEVSISQADTSTDGYLSSTDWNTFNNKLDGSTASSNFFLIGSGNTLWGWYANSSSKISDYIASGDEYSINYDWYNTNNVGLTSLLASGTKYSQAYISTSTGVFALAVHTHSIEDLSDVSEMTPSDGQGLLWDNDNGYWSSQTISTSDVAWSGASDFYGFSSNAINLFGASSHTHDDRYLYKENISEFTPDGDYEPATKKYVDDTVEAAGGYTDENAQDAVGEAITSGLSYNDNTGAIYISSYYTLSSQAKQGYLSGQKVKDIFDSSLYYNSSWIDTYSSNTDNRLDSLETYSSNIWNYNSGDLYYNGKVIIGHENFDLGNYNFQVSGDSYFSGSVTFLGEISGISIPTYPSGVSNKSYVDLISGSIITHISNNYYTQTWIDSLSGNIDTRLDSKQDLLDGSEYYPSSIGAGLSGSFNTHTSDSTIHFTKSSLDDDYTGSSNVNISLINAISSNLRTDIEAIEDTPVNWGTLTEGTGIAPLTGVGISGSGDNDITVLGYSTISSQAKQGYEFSSNSDIFDKTSYITSSNTIERFADSSNIQSKFLLSGVIYNAISSQSMSSNNILVSDIYISDWDNNSITHTVRDWFRLVQSPGWISGGTIYHVSTNSNTSPPTLYVTVSGGQGLLRETDNDFSKEYFVTWPTSSNIPITASNPKEFGIEWNSGDPKVKFASPGYAWNYDTEWPIGLAVNRSGSICFTRNQWSVRDPITNIIERLDAMGRIVRDATYGGLILSNTGTRNINITAGKLWSRLNEHYITGQGAGDSIDTSAGDTFVMFVYKTPTTYTVENQTATQWPNLYYYNTGTETLTTVGNNKYANLWVYITAEGVPGMIYGTGSYANTAEAEQESPPTNLPICIQYGGIFLGRIIFKYNTDTPVEVQTAFDTVFNAAEAATHNNLAGLNEGDYQHLTATQDSVLTDAGDASTYHYHDGRYYTETESDTNFAPSSLTKLRYDEYVGHSGNTNIHFTVDSIRDDFTASSQVNRLLIDTISSNLDTRIDSLFSWSSNALDLYGASSHTHDDRYYTETEIDNNFYTQTWIDSLSGSIDDRLEALEGVSEITWLSLETLSSNATDAYNWVNASSQRYESILSSGNEYSTNYSWYDTYHTQLENYLASGDEYSTNYDWYNTNHDGLDSLLTSGNKYSQAYASTSTGVFALATHTHDTFGLWSGASEFYAFSSNVKDDITSLFDTSSAHKTRLDNLEGESGIGDISWTSPTDGLGITTTGDGKISGSITITVDDYIASSVAVDKFYYQESDLTSVLNDNYYPSSLGNQNITALFTTSSNFNTRIETLENQDEFVKENYITSSNAISRFLESGGAKWVDLTDGSDTTLHTHPGMTTDVAWSGASEYYGHSSNSSIHFTEASIDHTNIQNVGSNTHTQIDSKLTDLFNFSTNAIGLYHPSSYGIFSYISSQIISGGSITSSDFNIIANTISGLIDPIWPSAATNKHYVDTISGALDTRIDSLFGWSSNAISLYAPSSTTRYGWAYVANGATFAHNCGSKPSWVNLSPSGTSPIMYSFTIDTDNVTVYHSSPDSESFSWRAVI